MELIWGGSDVARSWFGLSLGDVGRLCDVVLLTLHINLKSFGIALCYSHLSY